MIKFKSNTQLVVGQVTRHPFQRGRFVTITKIEDGCYFASPSNYKSPANPEGSHTCPHGYAYVQHCGKCNH